MRRGAVRVDLGPPTSSEAPSSEKRSGIDPALEPRNLAWLAPLERVEGHPVRGPDRGDPVPVARNGAAPPDPLRGDRPPAPAIQVEQEDTPTRIAFELEAGDEDAPPVWNPMGGEHTQSRGGNVAGVSRADRDDPQTRRPRHPEHQDLGDHQGRSTVGQTGRWARRARPAAWAGTRSSPSCRRRTCLRWRPPTHSGAPTARRPTCPRRWCGRTPTGRVPGLPRGASEGPHSRECVFEQDEAIAGHVVDLQGSGHADEHAAPAGKGDGLEGAVLRGVARAEPDLLPVR